MIMIQTPANVLKLLRSALTIFALCVAGLALLAGTRPALAQASAGEERVEADVSSRQVSIETNFAGTQIVVFGAVDNSRQEAAQDGIYDVVVVVRGPEEDFVVRRKDRVFGVWINNEARTFSNVPSYYAVLSTRPLEEIAQPTLLQRYQIGLHNLDLITPADATPETMESFREALVRLKSSSKLYQEQPFAVGFISKSLFRGTLSLPSNVPTGNFSVQIFLFRQGEFLSRHETQILIDKAGFERFIYDLAYEQPLVYGIAAVLIAIAAGLAASALFRK
jgi:uncharacterized protein (TIGR02186 family)